MDTSGAGGSAGLSEREKGFLARLAKKYETDESAGLVRSYLIAAGTLLVLFAAARWIPHWLAALAVVEAAGLLLYHKYKKFSLFKTRVLVKMWRERAEAAPGPGGGSA